jgi:putative sigma-54 modulation protein
MKIDITGRHIDVTPALREFTEERLRKLERLLVGPLEVHVVLGIAKHRHTAEIQVKSKSVTLTGEEETDDLYASIREVADKLERQALKHKQRIHDHKHRHGPRDPEVAATIGANAAQEEEEAEGPPDAAEAPLPRIVESRRYRLKPMSAEDAVLELVATSEDLLVFREASTDRVNVVYRQKDGNFGLIDPEF